MPKYRHLTESEYKVIKHLLDADLKQSKVVELTGRSSGTVFWIKKSNNWNDYRELISSLNDKYIKVEDDEPEESVTDILDETVDEPTATEDSLERIADALERLADAWEARPQKRGLLG